MSSFSTSNLMMETKQDSKTLKRLTARENLAYGKVSAFQRPAMKVYRWVEIKLHTALSSTVEVCGPLNVPVGLSPVKEPRAATG
jgi:hypothetical protein